MPISPARVAAFEILLRVQQTDAYAAELLHSAQHEKLSSADHGLATELVMGVLRWRSWLDRQVAEHSSQPLERLDPEILIALRLAAYQLQFLTRVPERAAVHESVELVKRARKRSAAGFVNAVLRGLAGQKGQSLPIGEAATAAELAERAAHPLWLVERWEAEFGLSVTRRICAYDQQVPEAAIRFTASEVENELQQQGIVLAPGQFLASARRVQSGDVTGTAAFREQRFSIQDEASQLVALLVGRGANILDCCAAPGGKTRILSQQNPSSTITALELHPHRADLLRKLVSEKNVHVVGVDINKWEATGQFDRVLADVPCSGTGTLARNPEIKWRLRSEDLADLHARQLAILRSAMQHVAPGGRLVYSTCSLEREENQAVVEAVVAADSSLHVIDCRSELERLRSEGELIWSDPEALLSGPYMRTIPGVHRCDGFFAAVIQRS